MPPHRPSQPPIRILTTLAILIVLSATGCQIVPPPEPIAPRVDVPLPPPAPQEPALCALDPPYDKQGTASWYGRAHHGKRTASGEIFDMNALTAAHRTLPMGTLIKVTNLKNGRSALLTANDRGPFIRGRILDVSHRAAEELDFRRESLTKVRIEAVTPC